MLAFLKKMFIGEQNTSIPALENDLTNEVPKRKKSDDDKKFISKHSKTQPLRQYACPHCSNHNYSQKDGLRQHIQS